MRGSLSRIARVTQSLRPRRLAFPGHQPWKPRWVDRVLSRQPWLGRGRLVACGIVRRPHLHEELLEVPEVLPQIAGVLRERVDDRVDELSRGEDLGLG